MLYMSDSMCYMLYAKLLYASCHMPSSICLIAICQMLWPLLCLLVWLQSRLDISLYIYITRLWLSILPLQRRDYYHTTMASIYISGHMYFSLPTYHGIDQNLSLPTYRGINQNLQSPFISVGQHIKASISNSYRRLFRYANISRHYIITSVIANSGSAIYRDIDLKANKYHISYHIRSHRVSRFGILT
jgi:hypothetical protein